VRSEAVAVGRRSLDRSLSGVICVPFVGACMPHGRGFSGRFVGAVSPAQQWWPMVRTHRGRVQPIALPSSLIRRLHTVLRRKRLACTAYP
jgi:hypothetical protein